MSHVCQFALALLAPCLLSATPAAPLLPDAHKWEVAEIFSTADGSVQFIEWFNDSDDEHLTQGESFTTSLGTFTFPVNLPSTSTANRRMLVATASFAALPGAPVPDFIMPANMFDPAGDTIDYTGGDVLSFGAVPADGVTSMLRSGASQANSPTNFAGVIGSINAAGQPATFETFGAGCEWAPGQAMSVTGTPPALGGTFTVTFHNRPTPVVLAQMGLSRSIGLGIAGTPALPLDLTSLGMPGCQALVSAELGSFFLGTGELSLPIPNLPAFTGLPLNVQGVSEAPGSNAMGFVISDAARGVVGN